MSEELNTQELPFGKMVDLQGRSKPAFWVFHKVKII